jgi:hypothetical protein
VYTKEQTVTSHLIRRQGIDRNGKPYTRMVRAERPGTGKATYRKPNLPKLPGRSDIQYAAILGWEDITTRNSDSYDFREVGIGSVRDMIDAVANDHLGRSLTDDEMKTVIFEHFRESELDWQVTDLDGNPISPDLSVINNSDSLDFFEIAVWDVPAAIEQVKSLNKN